VIGGLGGFGTGVILAAALAPLIRRQSGWSPFRRRGVIIKRRALLVYRAHVDRRR